MRDRHPPGPRLNQLRACAVAGRIVRGVELVNGGPPPRGPRRTRRSPRATADRGRAPVARRAASPGPRRCARASARRRGPPTRRPRRVGWRPRGSRESATPPPRSRRARPRWGPRAGVAAPRSLPLRAHRPRAAPAPRRAAAKAYAARGGALPTGRDEQARRQSRAPAPPRQGDTGRGPWTIDRVAGTIRRRSHARTPEARRPRGLPPRRGGHRETAVALVPPRPAKGISLAFEPYCTCALPVDP